MRMIGLTLLTVLLVTTGAFAQTADQSSGEETDARAYIVAPDGRRMALKDLIQIRRHFYEYLEYRGLRAPGDDGYSPVADDVEICDFGAGENLCPDEFDDLVAECVLIGHQSACCEIDPDMCPAEDRE